MAKRETVVWAIHAGKTGAADSLFLKKSYIAIGWRGKRPQQASSRPRGFQVKSRRVLSGAAPGAIPVWAGQMFRFVDGRERPNTGPVSMTAILKKVGAATTEIPGGRMSWVPLIIPYRH